MSVKRSMNGRRVLASIAMVALTTGTLAACSSEDGTDAESSSSSEETSQASSEETPAESGPPEPVAAIDSLTGNRTEVALDAGFTGALEDLGLTPAPLGDGSISNQGSLRFPITGGNVTVFEPGEVSPYVIGQVQHEGSGLSLTAGDTTVQIENLNVDPGVSRVYGDVSVNGELAAPAAYVFTLNGSTLMPLEVEGNTAVLEGSEVFVSPVAAGLLNETFGTDAVTEDLLVGIARVAVNTTPGD